jgi:hypothetical protein
VVLSDPIEAVIQRLIDGRLVTAATLVGCSAADIEEVETAAGGPVPAMYRRFLLKMGRSAGDFMRGTDVLFPRVLTLRETAEALLRTSPFNLGPSDFVFSSHQGYQFLFFNRLAGEDPPVLYFLEGETRPREVSPRFSAWLAGCVSDELADT